MPNSRTQTKNPSLNFIGSFIVGLSTLFYLYEFFLRVMPTIITAELMREFHIGPSQLGQLLACFFYAYAAMQIPAGLFCDKYGPKICLCISVITCAIMTLIFQSTSSLVTAEFSRLVIGAMSAYAFVGPLTLAAHWFPADKQALIAGIVQVMGCLGAIFAGQPLAVLIQSFGWRSTLYVASWVGVIITVFFVLFLKNKPANSSFANEEQQSETPNLNTPSVMETLSAVTKKKQNWYIGIAAFSSWAPVAIIAESWGIPYLSQMQGISIDHAASEVIWVWVSMAIASPLAGWYSNHIKNRKKPTLALLITGFVCSCYLIFLSPSNPYIVCTLLFGIGVASSCQPITFGMINDNNSNKIIGTAVSFNNMLLISSAMILQPMCGYLFELFNGKSSIIPLATYQKVFSILPFSILIGILICHYCIKETNCNKADDTETTIEHTEETSTQNI